MTRRKILSMGLVSVFAMGAIATASASAKEAELTLENGAAAKGTSFTSKLESGSKLALESVKAGSKITCTAETSRGTVTGPTTATSTIVFTGCESSAIGKKCESGSTSGEIISTASSKLGTINSSKGEYGLLYALAPNTKFECGSILKDEVKGSFIASILKLEGNKAVALETPFLTWTTSATQSKGVQGILHFEGQGNELLEASENGGAFEMAGEELEVLQTFSKKVRLTSGEEIGVETESGWKAEGSGGGEFDITSNSKVTCEKVTFAGVSPASGFSTTSDMAPTYSGCHLEIEKESKITKTNAEVKARGCDFQYSKDEEPSGGKFTSEFDISNCTGAGILITDSELEVGKTCEINIPDQSTAKEDDEDSDKKEGAPFESESKIDATDVKGEIMNCPEEIEKGKEPQPFFVFFIVVPRVIFIGLYFIVIF
jgi:hypothetical protein